MIKAEGTVKSFGFCLFIKDFCPHVDVDGEKVFYKECEEGASSSVHEFAHGVAAFLEWYKEEYPQGAKTE